jgi:hypothetical protein
MHACGQQRRDMQRPLTQLLPSQPKLTQKIPGNRQ